METPHTLYVAQEYESLECLTRKLIEELGEKLKDLKTESSKKRKQKLT